jgi:hypothetical protein
MAVKRSFGKRFTTVAVVYLASNIVLILVGALFLQSGSPDNGEAANEVLVGVGVSLLAAGVAGIVMLGWVVVSDTTRNRIVVLQEFGIRDYFDTNTTSIQGEYAQRLTRSRKRIDVLGLGLNHLRKDFNGSLRAWAESGVVRILLIDPDYPTASASFADQRDVEERDGLGSIRMAVEAWLSETADLRTELASTFQVRLYTCLPTITMVRVDKEIFWSPYLMHRGSGRTPTMLLHSGGTLFDVMTDHFDRIWTNDSLSRPAPLLQSQAPDNQA